MKRVARIAAAAVLVACALVATWASATTATGTVAVTATVTNACIISTAPLAFGAYAPIGANATAPLAGTAVLTVQCTGGSGQALGLSDGLYLSGTRRMKEATSANYLAYELYQDAASTIRWGDAIPSQQLTAPFFPFATTGTKTVTIYGQIPAGQAAAAGSYSDSVTATIYF
jgi:spore coat protein U-like protein